MWIKRLAFKAFQLAIVLEIAISSSSSLKLVLGPKGNGVTKSSLLLQLDHCSTRWVLLVVCRRSSCFSFSRKA
uniref:Secreted protein n=1 Tax=Utricularia reniformis TaxID=192314 RepID=A0A1Y0B274_9LAMI|nr:hypothetical protein AEK19_MT1249 [Utricularia reniformis]ART31459.1 hypothetical protein AEK19_MT1249 [Utricularia reniformis]